MREKKYNRHHAIAKSKWWTNHYDNVSKKEVNKHNAWHYCFWTKWPASQILEVLTFNEKVRNPEFVKAQIDLLDLFQWNYYKKNCYKWKVITKSDTWNLYNYMYNNG